MNWHSHYWRLPQYRETPPKWTPCDEVIFPPSILLCEEPYLPIYLSYTHAVIWTDSCLQSCPLRTRLRGIYFHAKNCVSSNVSNCVCTVFNNQASCDSNCFKIELVKQFKYLGITIDQNMSWSEHILILKQYLRSAVRSLYRLRKFCDNKTLKTVYFGIFESKLQYGISCWGGAYQTKLQPLVVLQKCAIRKLCRANRLARSIILFRTLKILPLKHLYYFKVTTIFFIRGGYMQSPISNTRNLRSNSINVVVLPTFRTTLFRNFYSVVSCKLFNRLPMNIRVLRSLSVFLKKS